MAGLAGKLEAAVLVSLRPAFGPAVRLILLALAAALSGAAQEGPNAVCQGCHEQGAKLSAGGHAPLACASCHPKHEEFPHPANIAKPACGQCHGSQSTQHAASVHATSAGLGCDVCHSGVHETKRTRTAEFRKAVPELCGGCHAEPLEHFAQSVHGTLAAQGITGAPVCTDCHSSHSILPKTNRESSVNTTRIRDTCAGCHGNLRLTAKYGIAQDRVVSFDESFHGLAAKSGSQLVANCASCHGFHEIRRSSDPKSSIHISNLPATCGKCHPGAGEKFALGPIHQYPGGAEPAGVKWVRIFYQPLIALLIGFMFLHNAGDWLRKVRRLRFGGAPKQAALGGGDLRMYGWERVQHALLAVSFIVLAWSGFALKYPDQWWSLPLVAWESSWPVRGIVHRGAAAVMILCSVLHAVTLITSDRLRRHWKSLWPVWSDLRESVSNFGYNLGLVAHRPKLSTHSYIEKVEYWAVVWGTVIMSLTGVLLWSNRLSLKWLPKSWLDTFVAIHFYEAILATLAIVIWHFYTAIVDPDVYPMDTAWLTGRSPRLRAGSGAGEAHSQDAAGKTSPGVEQEMQ